MRKRIVPVTLFVAAALLSSGCGGRKAARLDTSRALQTSSRAAVSELPGRVEGITILVQKLRVLLEGHTVARLAVLDVTDLDGKCSALGRFLAEELTTGLADIRDLDVVERNRLRQVMADLTEFIAADPAMYRALQQSLGVDGVIVGTITALSASIKINARVVATDTGRVVAAASVELQRDVGVESLLRTPCEDAAHGQAAPRGGASGAVALDSSPSGADRAGDERGWSQGLLGEYYNLPPGWDVLSFPDEPTLTRLDRNLSFDWRSGPPADRIQADHFMARWTGQIHAPRSGVYTFHVLTDDGARVWIRSQPVFDIWRGCASCEQRADVNLPDGWHDFHAEYFEIKQTAKIRLSWALPDDPSLSVVPPESFRCTRGAR